MWALSCWMWCTTSSSDLSLQSSTESRGFDVLYQMGIWLIISDLQCAQSPCFRIIIFFNIFFFLLINEMWIHQCDSETAFWANTQVHRCPCLKHEANSFLVFPDGLADLCLNVFSMKSWGRNLLRLLEDNSREDVKCVQHLESQNHYSWDDHLDHPVQPNPSPPPHFTFCVKILRKIPGLLKLVEEIYELWREREKKDTEVIQVMGTSFLSSIY